MKSLIFVSVLGLFTSAGFAADCTQQEAQFIGNVKNLFVYEDDYAQQGYCSFSLEFTHFRSSAVCPLGESEATNISISYDMNKKVCPANFDGQQLSGVLVQKDGQLSID